MSFKIVTPAHLVLTCHFYARELA